MSSDIRATVRKVAEPIKTEQRESSSARVPTVPPGRAIVYTRYEQEKTVVMNPEDFHRLAALDEALAEISAIGRLELSDLVLKAHQVEDAPGEPVEDPAAIKALLGL
jgi:hypothetical protein